MANSVVSTTSLIVPSSTISELVELDAFFRPGSVGNGRMWISGVVKPGRTVAGIRYNINNAGWVTVSGTVEENQPFGFYITGNEPSDWATTRITELYQPTATYFTTLQVNEKPKIVTVDSVFAQPVANLAALEASSGTVWYWDEQLKTLYLKTPGDALPLEVIAIIDPIFEQGTNYSILVQVIDEFTQEIDIFNEEFIWPYQVRNYVDRYLRNLLPTYAQDDPYMRKLYTLYAKQAADMYSMIDDCVAQFLIDFTTWGVTMWESQLGVLTVPSLNLQTRRDILRARRVVTSTREEFFNAILSIAPNAVITELYDIFRVDIKLTGVVDPALRNQLEAIIQQKKPAGVRVVVSYGQFIAGISLAGDSL